MNPEREVRVHEGETIVLTKSTYLNRLLTTAAIIATPLVAHAAPDADTNATTSASATSAYETIVVTARKREEALTDIPLSMQAFSMEEIEASGVDDLQDLSRFTPSLNFVNGSQGQGGRAISEVRFRGLSTAIPTPTNQTGSVFVDGVYVLGGAQSIGFDDIERVEVIKGPQSAYFGRATFAGVVNYITRDPSDTFGGRFTANYSPSFNSYGFSGAIEGPIVEDILNARISASVKEKGAQYRASDGGELGKEHTDTISASFLLRPTDRLTVKLRGSYIEDNDGPAAIGYQTYAPNGNCPVGTPVTVNTINGSYDTTFHRHYQCGALAFDRSMMDQSTGFITFPATGTLGELDLRDYLVDNALNDPLLASAPKLDRFGLTREMIRVSAAVDYEISDAFSVAALFGYNKQDVNNIRDTDGTPRHGGFQAVPFSFEDMSFESRLSYDNDGWIRGSVGMNYFKQTIRADTDNGVSVIPERIIGGQVVRGYTSSVNNENDKVETIGIYGGIDIDPTDWMTISLEGRYQVDDYTKFGGSNAAGNLIEENLRSKNFTPRAIVKVTPVQDATLYASYSMGVLPGTVNSNFLALNAADQAAVLAISPNLQVEIGSEKLTNYEIGYKQYFPELRLQVSIAAFHMKWKNLKGTSALVVPTFASPIFSVVTPGTARINGLEFEGTWDATRNLSFRMSAGYLDAKYTDFASTAYNSHFGIPSGNAFKADGNYLARNPKMTGSFSTTWSDHLVGDWDYRVRGDIFYIGKQYIDESNMVHLKAYNVVNLSAAVENESVSLEFYTSNLFDKKAWMTGRRFIDVSGVPLDLTTAGQGAFATPVDRREIGFNVRYKF